MNKEKFDPANVVHVISEKTKPMDLLVQIKGPQFVEYRRLWNIANRGILVQEYPLHLDFEINGGCNLQCGTCFRSLAGFKKKYHAEITSTIPLNTFKTIIIDGVQQGLRSITLNGNNEPLLVKKIADYARAAMRAGVMDIMMHTNANLLTRDMANHLLDAGLTSICFSIDAMTSETYNKVRPGGKLDAVKENIDYFLTEKKRRGLVLPITRVSFVETKQNTHELQSFLNYWEERVDYVVSQNFVSPFLETPYFDEKERVFRVPDREYTPLTTCSYPFQRLLIKSNGDVTYCCGWYSYGQVVGNIYKSPIADIWMGEDMTWIRNSVNGPDSDQPESCRLCRKAIVGKQ